LAKIPSLRGFREDFRDYLTNLQDLTDFLSFADFTRDLEDLAAQEFVDGYFRRLSFKSWM